MTDLEAYYNKFNEEKRLDSRHGRVEFVTSMHYIHQCLDEIVKERAKEEIHILDTAVGNLYHRTESLCSIKGQREGIHQ